MAQTSRNFPLFNFSVEGPAEQLNFTPQASHPSRNGSQPWMPRAPRSVQYNIPSPSTSVRSTVTAPAESFYDRSKYHQSNAGPVESRIDPSLPGMEMHLVPPGQTNYNIARSFHEDSWNPLHMRTSGNSHGGTPLHQSSTNYKSFGPGPGSVGSAAPVSDSGFYSQSAVSSDPSRLHQPRVPQGASRPIGSVDARSTRSDAPNMARVPSDQRSQISRVSSRSGKHVNELECQKCHETMKCKSDYKCVSAPA